MISCLGWTRIGDRAAASITLRGARSFSSIVVRLRFFAFHAWYTFKCEEEKNEHLSKLLMCFTPNFWLKQQQKIQKKYQPFNRRWNSWRQAYFLNTKHNINLQPITMFAPNWDLPRAVQCHMTYWLHLEVPNISIWIDRAFVVHSFAAEHEHSPI